MHLQGNSGNRKKGKKPHKKRKIYSEKSFIAEATKANDESDCGMSLERNVSSL